MKKYCEKCNRGTIVKKDPVTGEEYTDYCDCKLQSDSKEELDRKLNESRIPKDYWNLSLNNYVNPAQTRKEAFNNIKNIEIVQKYLNNIEQNLKNGRGLYLYGGNNSGKTMVMCHILKEAIKKSFTVSFFTMSEIISWYMSSWFDHNEVKKDISIFKECDLLGIDDCFDPTKTYISTNNMQVAQIDDLFRYRVHNWKPIILTANISKANTSSSSSIINKNIIGLLDRKVLELTFYGDISNVLQDKLKKEIVGE